MENLLVVPLLGYIFEFLGNSCYFAENATFDLYQRPCHLYMVEMARGWGLPCCKHVQPDFLFTNGES